MLWKGAVRSRDYFRGIAADAGFCVGCSLHLSLRDGGNEAERNGGKQGGMEGSMEGGREVERDGGKHVGRQCGTERDGWRETGR